MHIAAIIFDESENSFYCQVIRVVVSTITVVVIVVLQIIGLVTFLRAVRPHPIGGKTPLIPN